MTNEPSEAFKQRQLRRGKGGRYAKFCSCEFCGKPAGWNYQSLANCNESGVGVVVCNRRTCKKLPKRIEAEKEEAKWLDIPRLLYAKIETEPKEQATQIAVEITANGQVFSGYLPVREKQI